MNVSKNKEVQDLLEEIMVIDEEKSAILEELREMIFTNFEETNERIMYGGIMFSSEKDEDWGGGFFHIKTTFHLSLQKALSCKIPIAF